MADRESVWRAGSGLRWAGGRSHPTDAGAYNTRFAVLTIPYARHYKCKLELLGGVCRAMKGPSAEGYPYRGRFCSDTQNDT
jgi:hypothetical protein